MWESVQGIRVFTFASKRSKGLKILFKGTKGKQTILQLCTEYLGLEWMQGWKVTKSWFDRDLTFFSKKYYKSGSRASECHWSFCQTKFTTSLASTKRLSHLTQNSNVAFAGQSAACFTLDLRPVCIAWVSKEVLDWNTIGKFLHQPWWVKSHTNFMDIIRNRDWVL